MVVWVRMALRGSVFGHLFPSSWHCLGQAWGSGFVGGSMSWRQAKSSLSSCFFCFVLGFKMWTLSLLLLPCCSHHHRLCPFATVNLNTLYHKSPWSWSYHSNRKHPIGELWQFPQKQCSCDSHRQACVARHTFSAHRSYSIKRGDFCSVVLSFIPKSHSIKVKFLITITFALWLHGVHI